MAKRKTKKITKKRVVKRKSSPKKKVKIENDPEYMVQLAEPKMVRKDVLESLRDVIIFMQGYEKFRKIQEEKVALFTALKTDIKQLNHLINDKLRKYLPRGKLKAIPLQIRKPTVEKEEEPQQEENKTEMVQPLVAPPQDDVEESDYSGNKLVELESQLKDIENQLKGI